MGIRGFPHCAAALKGQPSLAQWQRLGQKYNSGYHTHPRHRSLAKECCPFRATYICVPYAQGAAVGICSAALSGRMHNGGNHAYPRRCLWLRKPLGFQPAFTQTITHNVNTHTNHNNHTTQPHHKTSTTTTQPHHTNANNHTNANTQTNNNTTRTTTNNTTQTPTHKRTTQHAQPPTTPVMDKNGLKARHSVAQRQSEATPWGYAVSHIVQPP